MTGSVGNRLSRFGPMLSMAATTCCVTIGVVYGLLYPAPIVGKVIFAVVGAMGGITVSAVLRILVVSVLMPAWERRAMAPRLFWMAVQAVCTVAGVWVGLTAPTVDNMSRPAFVVMETVICFFVGITLTVVWVMLFDFLRYTVPGWFKGAHQPA